MHRFQNLYLLSVKKRKLYIRLVIICSVMLKNQLIQLHNNDFFYNDYLVCLFFHRLRNRDLKSFKESENNLYDVFIIDSSAFFQRKLLSAILQGAIVVYIHALT